MKQLTNNSSYLFCEQVSTVTSLFEKWNDCERAVVMYALLKKLPFSTLKFLQFSIENHLTQNFSSQNYLHLIESQANDSHHLQKVINSYISLEITEFSQYIIDKDSNLFESDLNLKDTNKHFNKKEYILHDILNMIPLLKSKNDEAKQMYLSLIPLAVEDTVRKIVAAELVQQIFSYLLIHPAISNEDRRSLSYWLHHLEDHIQTVFATEQHSLYFITNRSESTPENDKISSCISSNDNQHSWQTIAPPSTKQSQKHSCFGRKTNFTLSSSTSSDEWNFSVLGFRNSNSCQNGFGSIEASTSNDTNELNISFSKNGTEVVELETDPTLLKPDSGATSNGNTDLPMCMNLRNTPAARTRRSNSLTTPAYSLLSGEKEQSPAHRICSSSQEDLLQTAQKGRSYSFSVESPEATSQLSCSESQAHGSRTDYLNFSTQDIGMSNIGVWLKSLRLHKYIGIFASMTYEDMLQVTEEFLQEKGVTKGASHKLALCIDKLKLRYDNLLNIQKHISKNTLDLGTVIEELANMVLTPMKPVDTHPQNNVASMLLEVITELCQYLAKHQSSTLQYEQHINGALWIIERAMQHQSLNSHASQLKQHKLNLSKIIIQILPRNHYLSGASGCLNVSKARWATSKSRKIDGAIKAVGNDRTLRKVSCDLINAKLSTMQKMTASMIPKSLQRYSKEVCSSSRNQFHIQHPYSNFKNKPYSLSSTKIYHGKSASYPSFLGETVEIGKETLRRQEILDHYQHRHSFNNLVILTNGQDQLKLQQVALDKNYTSSELDKELCNNSQFHFVPPELVFEKLDPTLSHAKKCVTAKKNCLKGMGGDINSSLEFLCLQMTEQAIN